MTSPRYHWYSPMAADPPDDWEGPGCAETARTVTHALAKGAVGSDDDIELPAPRAGASGADWGVEDGEN